MRTERWSINRIIINPNNGQRQNCIWEKKKLFLYTPVWSFKLICITETIGKYWKEKDMGMIQKIKPKKSWGFTKV